MGAFTSKNNASILCICVNCVVNLVTITIIFYIFFYILQEEETSFGSAEQEKN